MFKASVDDDEDDDDDVGVGKLWQIFIHLNIDKTHKQVRVKQFAWQKDQKQQQQENKTKQTCHVRCEQNS